MEEKMFNLAKIRKTKKLHVICANLVACLF
jgi:hypothetical protein